MFLNCLPALRRPKTHGVFLVAILTDFSVVVLITTFPVEV